MINLIYTKPMFYLLWILGVGFSLDSCAYRFSNRYVQSINNIKTISVEGVFDTSKQSLGHEALWEAVQRHIAKDGHLKITPRTKADALLRLHVKDASIGPSGVAKPISGPTKNPKVNPGDIIDPNQLIQMSTASFFTEIELLSSDIEADVIDLRSGKIIFQKNYNGRQLFKSIRTENYFARNSSFLFYQEASRNAFKKIGEQVASQIVSDLLIRW